MIMKLLKNNVSTTNNGIFQGWGSSLCWWANRIGYSDELSALSAELFYSMDGLGLNIMRYNIGGGDDPAHKHITRTDSVIPGWLKWNSDECRYVYDVLADKNQLNVLKRCYEKAGRDAYVEAFSNSAPFFMTISGCSCGGENASVDNLKGDCYEKFAEYLAHVCAYINNALNITVKSIAAMNEPNTDYWQYLSPKQEGCHFDPGTSQSKMIIETAKAFDKAGLSSVEITGSDETSTDKQFLACQSYTEEAWKEIDRLSTHTYGTEQIKEFGSYVKEMNKNLWMSEVDGTFLLGQDAGEMAAALGFAKKIIDDMNSLSPAAWVMWQLIDSHISQDGYAGNKDFGMPDFQKGYWGVAVADHDAKKIILSKKYYALGQFTRYMRPGCHILHFSENGLASWDEMRNIISIVMINTEKKEQKFTLDVSEFCPHNAPVKVIRTSGDMKSGENWAQLADLTVEKGRLSACLKGYSITTYCIRLLK